MSSEIFPSDTCVLVCSGPSLNSVDPFLLGVPVVVVSTAIRVITNPHYWILADQLNEMHGEAGNIAYQNENIIKIIPTGKLSERNKEAIRSFREFEYASADRTISDIDSHVFSGKLPLVKGPHKSVTFGIQCLHHMGVKNVIWVGNDLRAESAEKKYAYESTSTDLRKSYNYHVTIDQVHKTLETWYPKAKAKGFNWYSWNCGPVFETFVPKFDFGAFEKKTDSIFLNPSKHSDNPIVRIDVNKSHPRKIQRNQKLKNNQSKKIKQDIKQTPPSSEELVVLPKITALPSKKVSPPSPSKHPRYSRIKDGNITSVNKRIRDSLR